VVLVEAGPRILAGSSLALAERALQLLDQLGVTVRTGATIAEATPDGFRLTDGQLVQGGVFVWAVGVKAPELVAGAELPTGHNGRVKVDQRTDSRWHGRDHAPRLPLWDQCLPK
jgi:NADH:ubiquinone reductase (H+-translocating)